MKRSLRISVAASQVEVLAAWHADRAWDRHAEDERRPLAIRLTETDEQLAYNR